MVAGAAVAGAAVVVPGAAAVVVAGAPVWIMKFSIEFISVQEWVNFKSSLY